MNPERWKEGAPRAAWGALRFPTGRHGLQHLQSCHVSAPQTPQRSDFYITRQAKSDTAEGGGANEYLPYVQIILLASLKRRIPFGDDPSKFKRCDLQNNSKNIQMVMEAENYNGFMPKTEEKFADYQVQLLDKPIPAFSLTTCTLVISTLPNKQSYGKRQTKFKQSRRPGNTQLYVTSDHLVPAYRPE